jgi:hypothetical protein
MVTFNVARFFGEVGNKIAVSRICVKCNQKEGANFIVHVNDSLSFLPWTCVDCFKDDNSIPTNVLDQMEWNVDWNDEACTQCDRIILNEWEAKWQDDFPFCSSECIRAWTNEEDEACS